MNNSNIDNALIGQKNALIALIDSTELKDIKTALLVLRYNVPVWCALNYAYKGVELCQRAISNIDSIKRVWARKELLQEWETVKTLYWASIKP